ncbi:MAG: protein involved in polysaccharide export with SLBB domain [Saprospiraceae bacterium]|jgi:protein involved in polysaccharide export with SLBB domain
MIRRLLSLHLLLAISLLAGPLWAGEHGQSRANYQLGPGDKLSILVFNQDDMSGEYTVNGSGGFIMPFIEGIQAEGLTIAELADVIIDKLKPAYLLNPRVSVEVLNFRPYYIIGEINSSGSYPYVESMTFLNAVAIAGGFSYRAKKKYVLVKREDSDGKEVKLDINGVVMPGDIIRVKERLF